MARKSNTIIVPANANDASAMVAAATGIMTPDASGGWGDWKAVGGPRIGRVPQASIFAEARGVFLDLRFKGIDCREESFGFPFDFRTWSGEGPNLKIPGVLARDMIAA